MRFTWDHRKRLENLKKHGVDFRDAPEMFRGPMLVAPDVRHDYQDERYLGLGFIRGRPMVVAFAEPRSDHIRVISLRKANKYEEAKLKEALGI